MTKQHFIALADVVRKVDSEMAEAYKEGEALTDTETRDWFIAELANFCAKQNPHFKRERWLAYIAGECGPNGGTIKKATA